VRDVTRSACSHQRLRDEEMRNGTDNFLRDATLDEWLKRIGHLRGKLEARFLRGLRSPTMRFEEECR